MCRRPAACRLLLRSVRVVGVVVVGLGEGGADGQPCVGDGCGVLPGVVDAELGLAGAVGDAGGDVQDEVAEGGDLGVRQRGSVVEAEQLGPAHQVGRGEQGFQPGGVFVEAAAGQVAQPGRLGLADAVFDAGVAAVAQLEAGELTCGSALGRCW